MATCLWTRLCGQLGAAATGCGSAVLIAGESGSAAAQAERFAREAGEGGVPVLVGRCGAAGETPPFGPWRALLGPEGAELLRGDAAPSEKAPGLLTWLERSGRQTKVLLLQDLQGADPASLELALAVARLAPTHGIILLGTYAPDELHRCHPLVPVLADLARAGAPTLRLAAPDTPDHVVAPAPSTAWHQHRAEALMAEPEPEVWTVAYHLWLARDPRAPAWLRRACESALAFGAFPQAVQACEWALELLPPGAPAQLPFLIRLGLCHCRLGNLRQALDCLDEALTLARILRSATESPAP